MSIVDGRSLQNGLRIAGRMYEGVLPKTHLIINSKDIRVVQGGNQFRGFSMRDAMNYNRASFMRNERLERHYTNVRYYGTKNEKKSGDKPNPIRKLNRKKLLIAAFLGSGASYFIYNVLLYLNPDKSSSLRSRACQGLIETAHSSYQSLKDFLTLPYHSFVLLDKLQPVAKGVEKTLVLSLNNTLVSYHYSILGGFEVLARPGLAKFIEELGKVYEIVLFSNEDASMMEEISSQIDPKGESIRFKLGKEAMRIYKGKPIKDLDYLNRNLDNVIVVDVDPENVLLHQSNAVIIPEFNGNGKDRELLQMIVFFKDMAKENVKNIRVELEKYGHYKPHLKYYGAHSKYRKLLPKA